MSRRSFLLSSLFALVCHMARAKPSFLSSRSKFHREFRLSTSVSPHPRNNEIFPFLLSSSSREVRRVSTCTLQDSGTKIEEITFVRGFLHLRFFNRAKNFHHEEGLKGGQSLFFFQIHQRAQLKVSLPPPFFLFESGRRFAEGSRIFQPRSFTSHRGREEEEEGKFSKEREGEEGDGKRKCKCNRKKVCDRWCATFGRSRCWRVRGPDLIVGKKDTELVTD